MFHAVDIEKLSDAGLCRETWTFYVAVRGGGTDGSIVAKVTQYSRATRPTKRQRWTVVVRFGGRDYEGGTALKRPRRLPDSEVIANIAGRIVVEDTP